MGLWSIKEVSEYLSIKQNTLYAWVNQGKIPSVKIHGLIRFHPEEIETWVKSFKNEAKTKEMEKGAAYSQKEQKRPSIKKNPSSQGHQDLNRLIERVKQDVYNPSCRKNSPSQALKKGR